MGDTPGHMSFGYLCLQEQNLFTPPLLVGGAVDTGISFTLIILVLFGNASQFFGLARHPFDNLSKIMLQN
ncbi:hypothetical protein [Desulfotruncus alcoholivorax]|uniref:hypothetical protein n=1 Tax=Desulfotruncus alcoholivorax TaxID=265477 RepID=UPI0003F9B01F|nr:hypothetical protein [Desulfotruncus alcoholivorax]